MPIKWRITCGGVRTDGNTGRRAACALPRALVLRTQRGASGGTLPFCVRKSDILCAGFAVLA